MSEMTHATGGEGAWKQGTMNDEEFERAAMAFRPSWEIGLDAARNADISAIAPAPAEGASAGGFAAPKDSVRDAVSAVVSMPPPDGLAMPSSKPPAEKVAAKPAEKPAAKPTAKPAEKPAAKPAVNAAALDDEPVVPQRKGGMMYGIIAGAVAVIALVGYFAFGSGASTSNTAASVSSNAPAETAPTTPAQADRAHARACAPGACGRAHADARASCGAGRARGGALRPRRNPRCLRLPRSPHPSLLRPRLSLRASARARSRAGRCGACRRARSSARRAAPHVASRPSSRACATRGPAGRGLRDRQPLLISSLALATARVRPRPRRGAPREDRRILSNPPRPGTPPIRENSWQHGMRSGPCSSAPLWR
ncbi:MAG: hypothetical protein U0326_40335 [Polyangiales bacterium]